MIFRDEEAPVYPRTCPPRSRTQKAKPAITPVLPVPVFRDETLEAIPESFDYSSEDDTYRKTNVRSINIKS